ncbi:MAG: YidB family protein [Halioglobus sp.]
MDLIQLATQLITDKLGLQVDQSTVSNALSSLLGDGSGNIDLAGLAGKMTASGGLGSIVESWLGDGANAGISAGDILGLLGEGQVADFASQVGTDTDSAASGLASVLPELMDKASSGGSLLDAAGGLGGLMGAASSFLK